MIMGLFKPELRLIISAQSSFHCPVSCGVSCCARLETGIVDGYILAGIGLSTILAVHFRCKTPWPA